MARPKIPRQKDAYKALENRLNGYVLAVQTVYDNLSMEVSKSVAQLNYDGTVPFKFSDYPQTKRAIDDVQTKFVKDIRGLIYRGTSDEWKRSNTMQDLLVDTAMKFYGSKAGGGKHKVYYQTNSEPLKAFQSRKDKGLNLSAKLWNQSENYKTEMEFAISSAISKGTSAVTLSKRLSKYLHDFPSLQRDYKSKYGKAVDCHDCEYRSIRLARTEINMSYRMAEQERWKQFDFVLGYEIKLSHRHPRYDICDDLKGKYPKDFVWATWHPNCFCYAIPILKTEDEFWSPSDEVSPNMITAPPASFGEWMDKKTNLERIEQGNKRKTLPYWLNDNKEIKECSLLMAQARNVGSIVQLDAEYIADKFGGSVTPINYKSFSSLYRKLHSEKGMGVSDIKDAVRNTIVVEKGNIDKVINELQRLNSFDKYKPQSPYDYCGYSGNIVNLKMPNGIRSEIQVNTPKMIYAKETENNARRILGDQTWESIAKETGMPGGLGHKYYEEMRVLDKASPRRIEIEKLSREYYAHFNDDGDVIKKAVNSVEYRPANLKKVQNGIDDDIISFSMNGKVSGLEDFIKKGGLSIIDAQDKLNKLIDDSDIYMSIDGKTLLNKIIKGDGYFKSSIETGTGTFKTIGEKRAIKERKMFGMAEECAVDEYPKYGFLSKSGEMSYENIVNWGYGDTYVRFKPKVKGRSTFTFGDSYDGNTFISKDKLGNIKEFLELDSKYGTEAQKAEAFAKLRAIKKVENKETLWDRISPASEMNEPKIQSLLSLNRSGTPIENMGKLLDAGIDEVSKVKGTYVESQIYGKLSINDVSSIEVSSIKQKEQLEKSLKKIGADVDVVPCKYNTNLKKLENAFVDYDDKPSQFIYSLTGEDIDNLGDFYVNGITKRFCDTKNPFWKEIKMPDDFISLQQKISLGDGTIVEKRNYCKLYLEEVRKKDKGAFPKVWWENYRPSQGGWTSDVLQKNLLKRKE